MNLEELNDSLKIIFGICCPMVSLIIYKNLPIINGVFKIKVNCTLQFLGLAY